MLFNGVKTTGTSSLDLSTKSILVRDLDRNNLETFYEGLPYRYNSIVDLLFQEEGIKHDLLERLEMSDRLFYKVYILSTVNFRLPILECLQIDGISGGMLSTYLHDLDRDIIEGEGVMDIGLDSRLIWQALTQHSEFSFIFRASRNSFSRTSWYMNKVGFNEYAFDGMRCFCNGTNNGHLFLNVMQELISAIENTNEFYSFDRERFNTEKVRQARIAKDKLSAIAQHQELLKFNLV